MGKDWIDHECCHHHHKHKKSKPVYVETTYTYFDSDSSECSGCGGEHGGGDGGPVDPPPPPDPVYHLPVMKEVTPATVTMWRSWEIPNSSYGTMQFYGGRCDHAWTQGYNGVFSHTALHGSETTSTRLLSHYQMQLYERNDTTGAKTLALGVPTYPDYSTQCMDESAKSILPEPLDHSTPGWRVAVPYYSAPCESLPDVELYFDLPMKNHTGSAYNNFCGKATIFITIYDLDQQTELHRITLDTLVKDPAATNGQYRRHEVSTVLDGDTYCLHMKDLPPGRFYPLYMTWRVYFQDMNNNAVTMNEISPMFFAQRYADPAGQILGNFAMFLTRVKTSMPEGFDFEFKLWNSFSGPLGMKTYNADFSSEITPMINPINWRGPLLSSYDSTGSNLIKYQTRMDYPFYSDGAGNPVNYFECIMRNVCPNNVILKMSPFLAHSNSIYLGDTMKLKTLVFSSVRPSTTNAYLVDKVGTYYNNAESQESRQGSPYHSWFNQYVDFYDVNNVDMKIYIPTGTTHMIRLIEGTPSHDSLPT
jgi:hypothetical protein